MDDLLRLKGIGRTVITAINNEGRVVRLIHYTDGTWSIFRDSKFCGQWEADEQEICLRAFLTYSGIDEPITAALLASHPQPVASAFAQFVN